MPGGYDWGRLRASRQRGGRESITFQLPGQPITISGDGLLDLNGIADTIGPSLTLANSASIELAPASCARPRQRDRGEPGNGRTHR